MPELHVVHVFSAVGGTGGNPLGVFLDGSSVPEEQRQPVATDLGFAETVYVDDREFGELRIFTPCDELPLAGHPLVGTAWLLRETGEAPAMLRPLAGDVAVRFEGELTWISARPEWGPPFEFVQLDDPAEVDALTGPPLGYGLVGMWAWKDEAAGVIRERVFVPEFAVPEDEATGSAALLLCAQLGREIEIHQGEGSLVLARPLEDGLAEVGGRVELAQVREYVSPDDR